MKQIPGWTHYTASKAALLRLSEILQVEHPELRITNLSPGFVQTAMIEQVKDPGLNSMPRSSPELVGNFINWAASSEAEFLAGRFAWMQWDVEELKTRKEEILEKDLLLYTIGGI
jgi:NAD(P)-dependent dehydrogenase (short-subunit alcohol dehydrogenase family)